MKYNKFSTKNADYVVRYGLHRKNINSPWEIFEAKGGGVDGVVLEIRGSKVWTAGSVTAAFREILKGKIQKEDYDLIKYCKTKQIPIYVTSHEVSRRSYFIFWVVTIATLLLIKFTWPIILIFFLVIVYMLLGDKKKVSNFISLLMAINSMFDQSMGGVGVNALCAKKMEEYIAPRVRKKLKRKPKFGLNYGAGHVGLKFYFKNKRLREFNFFTLKYLNYEFWKKWGSYRGKVGKIYEANFNVKTGKWKVISYETHFFDE